MSSKHLRGVKPKITPDHEPLARVPKAPQWFSSYAVAEWKRVVPVLVDRHVICAADLAQVETYCCMAGLVRQIETERQLAGGLIDVKLFGVQNRAAQDAGPGVVRGFQHVARPRERSGGHDADRPCDPHG